jgi:predicted small secreted protein
LIEVDSPPVAQYQSDAMKLLLFLALAAALGVCGCGTFSGAGQDAVRNLEQGAEGRGQLVSPDPMGDEFGSYYE